MRLADDFFLLAIVDRTGEPKLSPRVFGLGVAAALLGELIFDGRVTINGDQLRVLDQTPPADVVAHTILDQLMREPPGLPLSTWLVFLAQRSVAQVADRLRTAGHLRVETVRRILYRHTVYPPTDVNVAYWPTARLSTALSQRKRFTWHDVALAGLAQATGLAQVLFYPGEPHARTYLDHLVAHLGPDLRALVWHLEAAVGDAVMTGRT